MAKFVRVTNIAQGIDMDTILNIDDIGHISIGPNIIFVKTPFADGTNRIYVRTETIEQLEKILLEGENNWTLGYEVEKEPKYIVEFKGIDDNYKFLNYGTSFKDWTFDDSKGAKGVRVAHTRKELEDAGFGWVFNCEGIEIEEVE